VQHLPQARVGGRDVRQPGACGGPRRAPGPVRYRMAGLTAQIYCHNLDATSARPALSSPPASRDLPANGGHRRFQPGHRGARLGRTSRATPGRSCCRGRCVNVFDASALPTFLQGDPGATHVQAALRGGGACGAANWSEVAQMILARGRNWDLSRSLLVSFG